MKERKIISAKQLNKLSSDASASKRKRSIFNYHSDFSDPINRMLNAFDKETYCQPHKHEAPDKREIFIVLKGCLGIILFNEDGSIAEGIRLEPFPGNPGIEIPEQTWHTAVALEDGTVCYEIKDGPYNASNDKIFAPWAPTETSPSSQTYLMHILEEAHLV